MMTLEYASYISEEALLRGMAEQTDPASPEEVAPLVGTLCDMYAILKQEQAKQPEVYQPGGEWTVYIEARAEFYRAWLERDISGTTQILGNFWRSKLGIVQQYATLGMLKKSREMRAIFIDHMAYDYMVWSNLFDAAPQELIIPPVSNPWGYYINDVMIAPKALRYHALATQIRQMASDFERPVVAEIGAGYGGTAYYLLRGNEPLVYVDFDLPEVLMLIAYYLKRTVPHRRILLYEPSVELDAAILAQYDVILMPNWMLPKLPANSVDVFLNTFSLSEMPLATVTQYIRQIERCCRWYFLHNNMDRKGVVHLGHERLPCSQYPISPKKFKILYKRYDLFQRLHYGRDGDYREVLYQRVNPCDQYFRE